MRKRRIADQRGLTLVEVTIATAVTAVISLVVGTLVKSSLNTGKSSQELMALRELGSEIAASLGSNADCMALLGGQEVRTVDNPNDRIKEPLPEVALNFPPPGAVVKAGETIRKSFVVTSLRLVLVSAADNEDLIADPAKDGAWHGKLILHAKDTQGKPAPPLDIPMVVAAEKGLEKARIKHCYSGFPSGVGGGALVASRAAVQAPLQLETRSYELEVKPNQMAALVCPKGTVLTQAEGYPLGGGDFRAFYPTQGACLNSPNLDDCDIDHLERYHVPGGSPPGQATAALSSGANAQPRGCILIGNDSGVGCRIQCLALTTR